MAEDGSCVRLRPCWPGHVWVYDFVQDRTRDGRAFRMLTVIDGYTRECLGVVVARRLRADDVLQVLIERWPRRYNTVRPPRRCCHARLGLPTQSFRTPSGARHGTDRFSHNPWYRNPGQVNATSSCHSKPRICSAVGRLFGIPATFQGGQISQSSSNQGRRESQ
jgi:hypothetical protein